MPNKPFLIYVVEDDEWYSKLLVHSLSLNPDFQIERFFTGKDLLKALDNQPSVVTVDYRLPDIHGDELIQKIKAFDPSIEVVVISEQEDIETAVELLKLGAYDYIVKSKDVKDRLLHTVNHIHKHVNLEKRISSLQKEVESKFSFDKSIIGNSKNMRTVFEMMEKAVKTSITVSVYGETGTGKEMVAKSIHFNSPRKENSFVAVNVGAIPSELIESELFGYEKGAFTGAVTARKGKFEEAQGGTLFLDEIGEMDINAQVKLLRVLQEKEVVRIGSNKTIQVDCRIICATNKNLLDEVKAGNFREDLYYRLFGLPIELPPLRDRQDDALALSHFFISEFCKQNGLEPKYLSEEARHKIMGYKWPGNVRELKSVIELAAVMSSGDEIMASDITVAGGSDPVSDMLTKEESLREYNIRIVQFYLNRYDNDTKKVADVLDIGQTTVYRLIKEGKELGLIQ